MSMTAPAASGNTDLEVSTTWIISVLLCPSNLNTLLQCAWLAVCWQLLNLQWVPPVADICQLFPAVCGRRVSAMCHRGTALLQEQHNT